MKKIILLAIVLCSLFLVGCKKDELKTYNITYKLFKGDFSEVSKDTFLKTEIPFEIQIPVKPGYEFVGWYDNESYTGDALLSITLEQDYTLFAKWEINTYTVSFETNGGEALDSITVPYKTEIDAPVDPVKEGYIFMDWYVDEVCLVKYSFYDEVISDFTLYAKWTQAPTEGLVFEEYSYGEYYKVTDYTGSSTEVIIPDYYNKKPVALIDYAAFYQNEDITSVRLPETLKEIKQLAFSGCVSLEAVGFPASLEIIENMAYYGCEALVEVVIPETVKSVSTSIFSHCINLESATILAPLTTISSYLFYFCSSLTSISLPSTVEEIHVEAFGQCASLETIVLPEGVTKLSYGVFNSCAGLKNINLPNSITEIAGQAFANCFVLGSITLPNSITSIEATTFMSCWSLKSIVIPDSVTIIKYHAFSGDTFLENVTLSSNLTTIEYNAFANCYGLETILLHENITTIGDNVFSKCDSLVINAVAQEKPVGWSEIWNPDARVVNWGYIEIA